MKQLVAGIAALVLLGLIIKHWAIILLAIGLTVAAVSLWAYGAHLHNQRQTRIANELAEQKRLAARADAEHRQYLTGDSRGIYGSHPPVDLDGDLRIRGSFRKLPPTLAEWRSEKRQ